MSMEIRLETIDRRIKTREKAHTENINCRALVVY